MHGQCLIAVYPSPSEAEKALRAAIGSGIPSDSVQISRADKPVWEWLFSKRVAEKDKKHYRSHLPEGETALSVLLDGASAEGVDAVEELLERFDPIDMHLEMYEEKKAEVPSAASGKESKAESAKAPAPAAAGHDAKPEPAKSGHQEAKTAAAHHQPAHEHDEQIIPLPEEEMTVSAQTSDRVRRVRTFVVEEPVEKEVSLSDERLIIEKRAATSHDADEPAERIYEFHERHDEPLIEKTLRVGEELVVRKEAMRHTERVHGTVRRTKAEIEKEVGAQLSPSSSSPSSSSASKDHPKGQSLK